MKCLRCSALNPEAALYCQRCGALLATDSRSERGDLWKSLTLALMFTGIFYLVFPMPVTHNQMLLGLFSGRISEVIFLLCVWSLFLVSYRFRAHRRQFRAYEAMLDAELHQSLAQGIFVQNIEDRIREIGAHLEARSVKDFQNSVMFQRVRRILLYLKAVPRKEEIKTILDYQAELDFNRMQGRYTLLNVFIWAIPIIGFIGTVFGIGQSIGEFSEFIRGADSGSLGGQLRSALGGVTSGLSVAFNTTFLALVGVIPIMVFSSSTRKAEEDLLLNIEEYCLEELLPHLYVHPGEAAVAQMADVQLERVSEFADQWLSRVVPMLDGVQEHTASLQAQVQALQVLTHGLGEQILPTDPETSEPSAEEVSNAEPTPPAKPLLEPSEEAPTAPEQVPLQAEASSLPDSPEAGLHPTLQGATDAPGEESPEEPSAEPVSQNPEPTGPEELRLRSATDGKPETREGSEKP
jgi:biopolymer transport protein ExbB/TolQ